MIFTAPPAFADGELEREVVGMAGRYVLWIQPVESTIDCGQTCFTISRSRLKDASGYCECIYLVKLLQLSIRRQLAIGQQRTRLLGIGAYGRAFLGKKIGNGIP